MYITKLFVSNNDFSNETVLIHFLSEIDDNIYLLWLTNNCLNS